MIVSGHDGVQDHALRMTAMARSMIDAVSGVWTGSGWKRLAVQDHALRMTAMARSMIDAVSGVWTGSGWMRLAVQDHALRMTAMARSMIDAVSGVCARAVVGCNWQCRTMRCV